MEPDPTLVALVRAYVAGDRVARLALADWLEEHGDPRAEDVRAARLNWKQVAVVIYCRLNHVQRPPASHYPYYDAEINRCRWLIDCALAGASVPPEVSDAVREAHQRWLAGLFPELS
jgi:uncharacterized protein (TIGR02996 family)